MPNQSDESIKFLATLIAAALWVHVAAFIVYGCSEPIEAQVDDGLPELIEDDGDLFFMDGWLRSDETVVATVDWMNPISDIPQQEVTFWCNVDVLCEVILRDADGNEIGRVAYDPEVTPPETPAETPSRNQAP